MTLVVPSAPSAPGVLRALVVAPEVAEVVHVRDILLQLPDVHAHGVTGIAEAIHLLEHAMFDVLLVTEHTWSNQPALRRLAVEHRLDFAVMVLSDAPSVGGDQSAAAVPLPPGILDSPQELGRSIADAVASVRGGRRRETMFRWLEREARTDHLTGLHNRRAFDAELARDCEAMAGLSRPVSLIIADVDGLRRINDFCGHTVGDAVLRRTANSIARSIRGSDFAARIGGDEFAVILPGGDGELARRVARRIAHEVERVNAESLDEVPEITLVFGIATGLRCTPEDLRETAEAQLATARPVRIPTLSRAIGHPEGPDVA